MPNAFALPSDPARTLDRDLKTAGSKKVTEEGKVDFHASRVAYVTLLIEHGANPKEAQDMARHATPDMTMNIYARSREGQQNTVIERVAETLYGAMTCDTFVSSDVQATQDEETIALQNNSLQDAVGHDSMGVQIPPSALFLFQSQPIELLEYILRSQR